ncbi:hypothetical protein RIF29_14717 [Crotalaria pallida]|uniref:TF-B3 domain-containing protein n=1 Tax=Crotalaria pallida TaxID=3830 RepID=A0AAN9FC75_CROPI
MVSDNGQCGDAKVMGFCKILEGHLQGKEFMIIPSSFERKHKITLPNPLILRLPNNGAEWKVSWTKHDYDIWFQQDWKKFALDCSLRDPQFFTFKYEGGSHFEVRIFDHSGDDIDYSSIRCTNNGATSTHQYDDEVETESDDSAGSEMQTQLLSKGRKIIEDSAATQQKVSAGARRGRRSMVKANKASVEENKFQYFPKAFLKRNRGLHGKCVKLQVGENSWPVTVRYYPDRGTGRFSGGWGTFMRKCKLGVGRFWEFDMIDAVNRVMKVSYS